MYADLPEEALRPGEGDRRPDRQAEEAHGRRVRGPQEVRGLPRQHLRLSESRSTQARDASCSSGLSSFTRRVRRRRTPASRSIPRSSTSQVGPLADFEAADFAVHAQDAAPGVRSPCAPPPAAARRRRGASCARSGPFPSRRRPATCRPASRRRRRASARARRVPSAPNQYSPSGMSTARIESVTSASRSGPLHLYAKPQQLRGEVLAVGDHFRRQFVEEERRLHDAAAHREGLRLPQPGPVGHRAEQVIDVPHAPRRPPPPLARTWRGCARR